MRRLLTSLTLLGLFTACSESVTGTVDGEPVRGARQSYYHIETYEIPFIGEFPLLILLTSDVAGTADRCCIAQARRVLVDHFPVHDETAATQHHTTAGVPGALLAVLPAEHSDHSFVLADQGQCAGVVMHLDSGALDRPGERCHQGCTAFFPEGFGLVRAWRGAG